MVAVQSEPLSIVAHRIVNVLRFIAMLLVIVSSLSFQRIAEAQTPVAKTVSLAGPPSAGDGITITRIKLRDTLPCLCWGDAAGSHLFALNSNGVLRRIELPDFKETHHIDLGKGPSSLHVSKSGLVVTLPTAQQVWIIDKQKLTISRKVDVAEIKAAACSLKMSFAILSNGTGFAKLDVRSGKLAPMNALGTRKTAFKNPTVTPDGKYLFTRRFGSLVRYKISRQSLQFEQATPSIENGVVKVGVQVSPDSNYICVPSGGGNQRDVPNHPRIGTYTTFVYSVTNLTKPLTTLESGAYPQAVGFDPVSERIYAQNADYALIVMNLAGVKQAEHRFSNGRDIRQFLPHPAGNRVLIGSAKELVFVELKK